jgi:hypothetical protein
MADSSAAASTASTNAVDTRRNSRRPAKKPRTETLKANLEPKPCGPCYFDTRLPFELIAEILLFTNSPKTVLALARTSKFLCNTLTGSNAQYIWRHVRENCLPAALPEPTPQFTESAFIAFIFDGGKCDVRQFYLDKNMMTETSRIIRVDLWS